MIETTVPAATETTARVKDVWQRLEEPFRFFGRDLPFFYKPGELWLVVLGLVLLLALVYVVWMYLKDSRSVGVGWAILLGALRLGVYALLAAVFLLPSRQHSLEIVSQAKVLLLLDVSESMTISDEEPTGPKDRPPTRMDRVLEFLTDARVNFLPGLQAKNPVTVYRFGSRLDEDYLHFTDGADGRVYTRQERERPAKGPDGRPVAPDKKELTAAEWRDWLHPARTALRQPIDDSLPAEKRQEALRQRDRQVDLVRGTNLGGALKDLVTKEGNNRLQGIVVFTDGRNTGGPPEAFRELERLTKGKIPIFVVAVGEERVQVKIELGSMRHPPQVQPEDRFRVKVELSGVGLEEQSVPVTLELTHVRKVKKEPKKEPKKGGEPKKGPDAKKEGEPKKGPEPKKAPAKDGEEEESLPIRLVERLPEEKDAKKPAPKRAEPIDLGTKIVLRPVNTVTFDRGIPPRAEAEFQIDPGILAKAAKNLDLEKDPLYAGKRWEIEETQEDSEFRLVARVPRHAQESRRWDADGKEVKEHVSDRGSMRVLKKPLRVLLFASAATRDYQFVQALLVREMDKNRMKVAVHLQLPPFETKARTGVVQSVPKERLLHAFPHLFDTEGHKDDLLNLNSYDAIVCFDPDWKRLSAEQIKLIQKWATTNGTGLIYLGGHFNTVNLVFPPEGDEAKVQPLKDLLPVELGDRRRFLTRKTDTPWPLRIMPEARAVEFMRLDEDLPPARFQEDWNEFFHGSGAEKTKEVQRGFFNFYPVKRVKSGSQVLARYGDPSVDLEQDREVLPHPFIVVNRGVKERIIWIGTTETWRLREFKEEFHERFWTKLLRYASANSTGPFAQRVHLEMDRVYKANRPINIDASIVRSVDGPLTAKHLPRVRLEPPAGAPPLDLPQPLLMTPRSGQDGWYSVSFQLRGEGEYKLTLDVPDPLDPKGESMMGEPVEQKFTVTPANPEMDDTRPDHDRMYRLAGEADEVLNRMGAKAADLKRRLQRPKLETGPDKPELSDKQRLYFDLKNGELIPDCMVADPRKDTSRGAIESRWDDGLTLWRRDPPRKPVKVSYVLLAAVGLLSVEWLIRKLLRLA
jgi:hypothetical protein